NLFRRVVIQLTGQADHEHMAGIRHFHRQAHDIPSPLFYLEVSTDFRLLPPLRQKNKKIESPSVEERPNLLTNLPSKWSAHRHKRDSSREESRDAPFQTGMLSRFSSLGHPGILRSEEHTSELQSRENLVCRLLL